LKCAKVVAGAGDFEVIAPDGSLVGIATTGAAFTSSHINFTLTDGTPDFALGDSFTIAIPAGSEKVKILTPAAVDGSQDVYGILIGAVGTTGTFKYLDFTSGGTYEIRPGDIAVDATSEAVGQVVNLALTSGTWADGDAAGTLILDNVVGTFQPGNINVGTNLNVATIAADASAYYPDRAGVAVVRDAIIDSNNLVWPAGATADQKTKALAQLVDKGIIVRAAA
jgi:hypothetical protein